MSGRFFAFNPVVKVVGQYRDTVGIDVEAMSSEQMIYSGDWAYTWEHAGPITRDIMSQLKYCDEFYHASYGVDKHIVIDTRVNMLMGGMYPSIPGWHCDDVPRGENGQPQLDQCDDDVKHFMVLLSTTESVSRTEFVYKPYTCSIDPDDVWHSVDQAVERDNPRTCFIPERKFTMFNQQAIHRASLATEPGWRLFFRCSITHRQPVNRLRNQVQVYVTKNGW